MTYLLIVVMLLYYFNKYGRIRCPHCMYHKVSYLGHNMLRKEYELRELWHTYSCHRCRIKFELDGGRWPHTSIL
jgi:DNA-directed RNA polymerase subunit RPC12/RpoP